MKDYDYFLKYKKFCKEININNFDREYENEYSKEYSMCDKFVVENEI